MYNESSQNKTVRRHIKWNFSPQYISLKLLPTLLVHCITCYSFLKCYFILSLIQSIKIREQIHVSTVSRSPIRVFPYILPFTQVSKQQSIYLRGVLSILNGFVETFTSVFLQREQHLFGSKSGIYITII